MSIATFPIPTRPAQADAFDETFASAQALIASTAPARGPGAIWRVRGAMGVYLYQEQAADAAGYHIQTAAGVRLEVLAREGVICVDAFGAIGDCPETGSTLGATDDSDAIEAALVACPPGGIVRFTAGKRYLVTRRIEVRDKSFTVDFNHCHVRIGDDSVWHVFFFGGSDDATPVSKITVLNGTFDGNRERQRYWPSLTTVPERVLAPKPGKEPKPDPLSGYQIQYTDKGAFATNDGGVTWYTWDDKRDDKIFKHAIYDRVLDRVNPADIGTRFYENSPVNGEEWNEDWINGVNKSGKNAAGINIAGEGNNGIVWIRATDTVIAENLRFQNYIRNGLSIWGVKYAHVSKVQSRGQLPTTFFEIGSLLFLPGAEASCIKIGGPAREAGGKNSDEHCILGGYYTQSVFLSEIDTEGGAIPVFVRSNEPKSPNNGIHVYIDRCRFVGHARELWFELCSSVMISNSDIICVEHPESFARHSPGVFFDGRTTAWGFTNCHIRGRVNSGAMQSVARGFLSNSTLEDFSGQPQRPLTCRTIDNSYIVTRGAGILAEKISNSWIYCDTKEGCESLKVVEGAVNTTFGRERFEGMQERVLVARDTNTCTLSGAATHIDTLYVRQPGFAGGRWYVVDPSMYVLSGDTITFTKGTDNWIAADEPVEVDVHWYATRSDTFTLAGPDDAVHDLSRTGGVRTQDITTLTLNGTPVPHASMVSDTSQDVHWTSVMRETGRMRIKLVNGALAENDTLRVAYNPPLWPYRPVTLHPKARVFDSFVENSEGVVVEGGTPTITGAFQDISGDVAIRVYADTERVTIKNATFRRLAGGMVCCTESTKTFKGLWVEDVVAEDWGLEYLYLKEIGRVVREYLIGALRASGQGIRVTDELVIRRLTARKTGKEGGAYTNTGRNRGDQLKPSAIVVADANAYLGGATAFVVEPEWQSGTPIVSLHQGMDIVVP